VTIPPSSPCKGREQRKGKGMAIDLNRSALPGPLLKDETFCTLKMFSTF